jgi:hypothetical protein
LGTLLPTPEYSLDCIFTHKTVFSGKIIGLVLAGSLGGAATFKGNHPLGIGQKDSLNPFDSATAEFIAAEQ